MLNKKSMGGREIVQHQGAAWKTEEKESFPSAGRAGQKRPCLIERENLFQKVMNAQVLNTDKDIFK